MQAFSRIVNVGFQRKTKFHRSRNDSTNTDM